MNVFNCVSNKIVTISDFTKIIDHNLGYFFPFEILVLFLNLCDTFPEQSIGYLSQFINITEIMHFDRRVYSSEHTYIFYLY